MNGLSGMVTSCSSQATGRGAERLSSFFLSYSKPFGTEVLVLLVHSLNIKKEERNPRVLATVSLECRRASVTLELQRNRYG